MSKLVLVCARNRLPVDPERLRLLSRNLSPDNIVPREPKILHQGNLLIGIFNPADTIAVAGMSVCLGHMCGDGPGRWIPATAKPDGTYALFRVDETYLELVSDKVGSRTIWYVDTGEVFIASTSQRAIVSLLGGFSFNEQVIPWVLSSGTLGPDLSWDRRIKRLSGDSSLLLNRGTWEITVKKEYVRYTPENRPAEEFKEELSAALENTFDNLKIDVEKWVLPLSGGYDSRAMLLTLLSRNKKPKCITWGTEAALRDKKSDACVARALTQHLGLDFNYFKTDLSNEPVEIILPRFLAAGEGRIDNIAGYMDGFAIWKHLHESGCTGVIRGDEAFGDWAVTSDIQVLDNVGFTTLNDYANLKPFYFIAERYGQERPKHLEQGAGETREQWRDRINIEFEHPVKLAALNDLKLPYVEIVNPLLSRKLLSVVFRMPDKLRTDKNVFKLLVKSKMPEIPFAERSAIATQKGILEMKRVRDYLIQELDTEMARTLLPAELVNHVLQTLSDESIYRSIVNERIGALVSAAKRKLLGRNKLALNGCLLAFRAYMIVKMNQMLETDAALLRH